MIGPARSKRGAGPLAILQLHGRFDGGPKDKRVVRLMNHWGAKARHDMLIADPTADAARAESTKQSRRVSLPSPLSVRMPVRAATSRSHRPCAPMTWC